MPGPASMLCQQKNLCGEMDPLMRNSNVLVFVQKSFNWSGSVFPHRFFCWHNMDIRLSTGSASPENDPFFECDELDLENVPVEERPDFVLRANLQRAIAHLCFRSHLGRYVLPHVPRQFLQSILPRRLVGQLKAKDTAMMRQVNKLLNIPKKTAYEARDYTEPSRYVGSFGTMYRHITIIAPSADAKVDRGSSVFAVQKARYEYRLLLQSQLVPHGVKRCLTAKEPAAFDSKIEEVDLAATHAVAAEEAHDVLEDELSDANTKFGAAEKDETKVGVVAPGYEDPA